MPIRHPNGIWMPSFSPPSIRVVAPSSLMLLSEIWKVAVPPSPPLSVRAMVNRSVCSLSRIPASVHTFSTVSSMAGGPHAHVERSFQSGTRPSSAAKSTLPMSAVSCRCSR